MPNRIYGKTDKNIICNSKIFVGQFFFVGTLLFLSCRTISSKGETKRAGCAVDLSLRYGTKRG